MQHEPLYAYYITFPREIYSKWRFLYINFALCASELQISSNFNTPSYIILIVSL